MKIRYIYLMLLLLWCSFVGAQEQFNKIIYDSYGNISNTVIAHNDSYVVMTGSLVNGERGIVFTKLDSQGNILFQKKYRKDNYLCFEGKYNCLKYNSLSGNYYMCGIAITSDYQNKYPFVALINENLDTLSFSLLEPDSVVYGTYNICQLNDSIYSIINSSIVLGDYDMSLMIYNSFSETLENEFYIGEGDFYSSETGTCIIKTSSNNLILGGYTFGFNSGNYPQDWYLVKTDSIGNLIWTQHYGNPEVNDGYIGKIVETQDSLYLLSGGQGICVANHEAILEAALRKVDTSGNLVWEKFYRHYLYSQSQDEIRYSQTYFVDIIELENDCVVGLLYYKDYYAQGRFLLMKLTEDGKMLFTRRLQAYEELGLCQPSSIKQTDDNGFIICGHADFSSGQQFFLIKTDSLGCEGSVYTQPPPELISCIGLPDTLYCEQTYNCKLQIQGKSAPYSLSFSSGEQIDSLYYPPVFLSDTIETGSEFEVNADNVYYTHTYDSATIFNKTVNEESLPDYIEIPFTITVPENYSDTAISVSLTNGIGETFEITLPVYVWCDVSSPVTEFQEGIRLFPNPASNILHLQLPEYRGNAFIKLINMQGKTLLNKQIMGTEAQIDISDLPSGNYMARIYNGNKIENVRFEKE